MREAPEMAAVFTTCVGLRHLVLTMRTEVRTTYRVHSAAPRAHLMPAFNQETTLPRYEPPAWRVWLSNYSIGVTNHIDASGFGYSMNIMI